jgi:hypothetical protein
LTLIGFYEGVRKKSITIQQERVIVSFRVWRGYGDNHRLLICGPYRIEGYGKKNQGGEGKENEGEGDKGGGEGNKKGWRNQGEFKRGKGFQSSAGDLGPFDRFGWSGFGSFQVWAMASPGWFPVRPSNFLKEYRFFSLLVLKG